VKFFIQLIFRLAYLSAVGLAAFLIGIFTFTGHGGSTLFRAALASIYLLTFVPAFIVGVLPIQTLVSPPLILRVWFYFIGLLIIVILFSEGAVQHGWFK